MAIQLNHTIVHTRDPQASARALTELLGRAEPFRFGPFFCVELDNGVTLDFLAQEEGTVRSQHYAFLVGEAEFEQIYRRIRERGLEHWADPGRRHSGQINHHDGGRGVYWADADGHLLEIITRPYGGAGG
jgi:catechol 2,3-dioxygenase-like lactoylglutathione lyase family enzyme